MRANFILLLILIISIPCFGQSKKRKKKQTKFEYLYLTSGFSSSIFHDKDWTLEKPQIPLTFVAGFGYQLTIKRFTQNFEFRLRNEKFTIAESKTRTAIFMEETVPYIVETGYSNVNLDFLTMSYEIGYQPNPRLKWLIYLGHTWGIRTGGERLRELDIIQYGRFREIDGSQIYVPFDDPRITKTITPGTNRDFEADVYFATDFQFKITNKIFLLPRFSFHYSYQVHRIPVKDWISLQFKIGYLLP